MKDGGYRNVPIVVDNSEGYETVGFGRRIFNYLFWFPFANCLPKGFGTWLFVHSSKRTNLARRYSKTYKALELIYSYNGLRFSEGGIFDSLFSYFWESNMLNAWAVRNRLRLVKKELKEILLEKRDKQKIRILSLASGSARAVIEVLGELKDMNIEVRLVDTSRNALSYSRELAEKYDVIHKISWVRTDVRGVEQICENWQPDIVEVVGLMDYLNRKESVELITKIYKCLDKNGSLIISNVNNNPERRFVKEIVNWDMVYRDPCELAELLTAGGFDSQHCWVIYEPICIHAVAIALKP